MAAPTRDSSTTTSIIYVDWTNLTSPADGNSYVLGFNLYWDAGTQGMSWTSLVGYDAPYSSL